MTRLAGVALRFDGVVYRLPKPGRHPELFSNLRMESYCGTPLPILPREAFNQENQGFYTDEPGEPFVDRKQAMTIARAARQLRRDVGRATRLVSEDAW